MIIFKHQKSLSNHLQALKKQGKQIVLIPTMGALHEGHISLLKSVSNTDALIVSSIFVNPTQFNDSKDFEKYPITLEKDIFKLEKSITDVLFLPLVSEIYPNGTTQKKIYDLEYLETILEGSSRPGHFQGVCQVVDRLIQIVQPNVIVLGQKDYQQCMVITKLVNIIGNPINVVVSATIREKDGLAMSSRNMRLAAADREKAPLIYKTMLEIKQDIKTVSFTAIKKNAVNTLTEAGFIVDYIEIANADTLEIIEHWNGSTKLVILVAAFINEIRLIDNLVV
jgi:pantoate--beta-alanine ligase